MQRTNFGRNVSSFPQTIYTPRSEQELLGILDRHRGQRFRAVGRLHSWSRIIESNDVMLDLRHFNGVHPCLEDDQPAVQVGAGCQIKRLLQELRIQKGWTLPSVGFITEQTVAGAISTGTHGSGRHSLSHYVLSVRLARYDSETGAAVIEEIRSGPELRAARCSLGCMGIIISVRMQCRPIYSVEEHFQEYPSLQEVIAAETEFPLQQFYLVPWRWSYFVQHRRESQQQHSKSAAIYHWYRFLVFDIAMHWLILCAVRILRSDAMVRLLFRRLVPASVIRNWRVVASSDSQLVMEHELFRHIELELFIPSARLQEALAFLRQSLELTGNLHAIPDETFRHQIERTGQAMQWKALRGHYCHHYPICVRRILPDDTLISMASPADRSKRTHQQETSCDDSDDEAWYSITLTNYQPEHRQQPFQQLIGLLASSMADRFGARPHWGKLFPLPPERARDLYPEFDDFQTICLHNDPGHAFLNQWTGQLLKQPSLTG